MQSERRKQHKQKNTKEITKMTTYKVTWKERWSIEDATFTNLEEAKKWAEMMRAMNYKEVRLYKVESTEIDF